MRNKVWQLAENKLMLTWKNLVRIAERRAKSKNNGGLTDPEMFKSLRSLTWSVIEAAAALKSGWSLALKAKLHTPEKIPWETDNKNSIKI